MTIDQLRTFIMVGEGLSLTQAAAKVYVSQPSASFRISSLEKELGFELFERLRSPQGLRLTKAGEAYLDYAKAALRALELGKTHAEATLGSEAA
jgi:LysR family cyn operon transcriptional activator